MQVSVGNILITVGYVEYYNSHWEEASVQTAVIAMVIVIGIVLVMLVVMFVWYRRFKERYPLPARIATLIGMRQREARQNPYIGTCIHFRSCVKGR